MLQGRLEGMLRLSASCMRLTCCRLEIDWNIVMYTWMESAAVYLRCVQGLVPWSKTFYGLSSDWPTVLEAAEAAQEGRDEDALRLLEWSDAEIQKIVRAIYEFSYPKPAL